ncbi:MAG: aminotransferase class I/II-fold pyridoxal phosphate-dependent enzyme [Gemmatales bacterium]|nr:aminotransferase class I/II-fold pyridoxal phosphate-dependent enzyme [Gemmatales bacterium]MDW8388436.1 aminotransferase class I/II-fold pyridoxal phosphate-dependent enzyme [Gemmatales bacterium]
MQPHWIAERMSRIQASGIRKVFDLAKTLTDPINLSIGQPHYDVPEAVKEAAIAAIRAGHNGYTMTQGIPELRQRIAERILKERPGAASDLGKRGLLVTSGTSGGLVLALLTTINPGDEVIIFDPFFVMYPHLVTLAGGVPVCVDTYPRFQIDVDKLKAALTPRTKAILFNSPANPTGAVADRESVQALAELARERNLLLISDEIYRLFTYSGRFVSPLEFNEDVLVVEGFSKTHAMTGWRLGFAHGPAPIIEEMAKLQQFTFVCAPSPMQYAGLAACEYDTSDWTAEYARKRDRLVAGLRDHFEMTEPQGAFYLFPKAPWGTGTEFVTECIRNNLLVIPGNVFSQKDTHFRISYAADDWTIDRGIEVLVRLARQKGPRPD